MTKDEHRRRRAQRRARGRAGLLGLLISSTAILAAVVYATVAGGPDSASSTSEEHPQPPHHADRVLADLASIGIWRGPFDPNAQYLRGDIVTLRQAYLFAWKDAPTLQEGFSPLPLVSAEVVAFDEEFDEGVGPFATGERINDRYSWTLTGAGYQNAVRGPGFATSSGNTYFVVTGIPRQISEFGSSLRFSDDRSMATMALQRAGFDEMWHVNWGTGSVGDVTYWLGSTRGEVAPLRYSWNSGVRLETNVEYELILRVRGEFIFGYVNGELAFIHLAPLIGELAAQASSIYVQNHSELTEVERQERVWVKVRNNLQTNRTINVQS
jgi:hypothetical protein